MAIPVLRSFVRASSLLRCSISFRQILRRQEPIFTLFKQPSLLHSHSISSQQVVWCWQRRCITHGSVNVVISPEGTPKFETHVTDPPKKEKWKTKKRLKLQRMKEKQKRKAANMRDPRQLGVKGDKKRKFATVEERIKYKLEQVSLTRETVVQSIEVGDNVPESSPLLIPWVRNSETSVEFGLPNVTEIR